MLDTTTFRNGHTQTAPPPRPAAAAPSVTVTPIQAAVLQLAGMFDWAGLQGLPPIGGSEPAWQAFVLADTTPVRELLRVLAFLAATAVERLPPPPGPRLWLPGE